MPVAALNLIITMLQRYSFLAALGLFSIGAMAQQYCEPQFANGCFSWSNLSISINDMDWVSDGDCANGDHSAMVAYAEAGASLSFVVESGNWTGCAVWVDWNNDFTFQESENIHSSYVGGSPSYIYTFDVPIPASTFNGNYRLRVIAPWGSDGTTAGENGSGPCGAYQYGNFDDFTLNISNNTGVSEAENTTLTASPNPTAGPFTLKGMGQVDRMTVFASDGRTVLDTRPNTNIATVDLSAHPNGIYRVRCETASGSRTVKVVKQ